MKRLLSCTDRARGESGVTNLMEYISLTSILLILLVVMMFTVNAVFMEGPANTLRFHAFTDIGNGISVRIVDIYVTAPERGDITSKFDIPDDVGGGDYFVEVEGAEGAQKILVQRGDIQSRISIAGIGASKTVTGNTTSRGWNVIQYNWTGFSGS
ncbi:MAG: hypothetical protein LUQ64_03970 [Methanomicrobiales archaeon]|nr:hypothetical protein [Methanomicrobiales archaeon]